MRLNDRARNKGRMAIYTMAGFYLAFMAYSMFKSLPTSSGGEKILMIVFMIFFAVVGVGMMVMGTLSGYKMMKEDSAPGTEAKPRIEGEEEDEQKEP